MAEILFLFDVHLCVQQTIQADQFKMVKATDFKFDTHDPTQGQSRQDLF